MVFTPQFRRVPRHDGSVGYELDLWGQIRNQVAAGEASAQAAAAVFVPKTAKMSAM